MHLSFVIPVYNEEESLPKFYQRVTEEIKKLKKTYEIVFVNDGSKDSSLEILKGFREKDKHIKIINFRRNYGKATALDEGFKYVTGEIVFMMDADLQDEPSEISNFLKNMDGYDMLTGWKKERHDPISKLISTKLFNFFISTLSGVKLHDFNCGFKCFRNEVVKEISLYGDMHRFIPVLASSKGFTVGEIVVKHNAREFGVSKFGFERSIKGLFDGITVTFLTKFLVNPLHLFGSIGILFSAVGFLIGLYLSFLRFQGEKIGDRPLLIFAVLLILSGFQFFTTGLIAEFMTYNKFNGKNNQYISLEVLD